MIRRTFMKTSLAIGTSMLAHGLKAEDTPNAPAASEEQTSKLEEEQNCVCHEQESETMFGKPKKKVCANCKGDYKEGDRYCRYCGAPLGKPKFINEDFGCIYGPPPKKRVHKCEKCGFSWATNQMLDNERYCPKCGGPAPVAEEDEWK